MKKILVLFLALLLLAVPVAAEGYFVMDDSGLMEDYDVDKLEQVYSEYPAMYGFTPALVTTDSFGGLSAEEYAGRYYDLQAYPEDGILLLVSLNEGEWYILTNGACYDRISNWDAEEIGEALLPMIRDGSYYAAFLKFPELAAEVFEANTPNDDGELVSPAVPKKNYAKTVAICMAVGMGIGLLTVGIMASQMKSVRQQSGAADYVRPGSMHLTHSRDIFLYSRVTRSAKPKNNSSSGGSRSSGGGRGGAGGRI